MTAPQDLTPYERRQNTFRQLFNREVREAFADVADDAPDTNPRKILRGDLLIEDNDAFSEMWLKTQLFQFVKGDDAPLLLPAYDDVPITVTDRPHVHLYFLERKGTAAAAGRKRATALISFRLVEKKLNTITQADLNRLRNEINLAFPSSYTLNKGRAKYSYRDKENGFEFILTLANESEARTVITKVCGLVDKQPDFDLLRTSTSEKNYAVRETITVLGAVERLPLQRPIATCYLKQAIVRLGKLRKIVLIDRVV